ncbi:MAG: IS481 family transposase [Jatrophihabitans sp.]
MSKAKLVITAVIVEGRSQAEAAAGYGVSKGWVSKLIARYRAEGEAAFEPRSRRPTSSPTAMTPATVELVLRLRKQLSGQGLDAGADTIGWHLNHHHHTTVSRATINRILTRAGAVVPQPAKRPKSSYIRFEADQPNECWQADFTHYRLTHLDARAGADTEILTWIDDCSRYLLSVTAHRRVTGPIVLATFRDAVAAYGIPASTLTDNGMVFTTRLSGGKGGRNGLETELRRLNVRQKNSRPNHPTTCGKVERVQQTFKKWLRAQPVQPASIAELQTLLDEFVLIYNQHRPHRSLPQHATPTTIYNGLPKATPTGSRASHTHDRVRHDIIDNSGSITLRVHGRLHHIGIGRAHARTRVIVLSQDLHVRVIDAATGELLRELTINPNRDYQPTGAKRNPRTRTTQVQEFPMS